MAQVWTKHKFWILAGVVVVILAYIFFGGEEGIAKDEFEDQIREFSSGTMQITDSKIEHLAGDEYMYTGHFNQLVITAKSDKDGNLRLPFGILTQPTGQMDEISLGQYQQMILALNTIAEPDLSEEDRFDLVNEGLDFNNAIMNGTESLISSNGLSYRLTGGGGSVISTFQITEED
jgi:hypothetical protein